jgi:hypothetical protein
VLVGAAGVMIGERPSSRTPCPEGALCREAGAFAAFLVGVGVAGAGAETTGAETVGVEGVDGVDGELGVRGPRGARGGAGAATGAATGAPREWATRMLVRCSSPAVRI